MCERGSSDCSVREKLLSQNICSVDVREIKKTNVKTNINTNTITKKHNTKTTKNSLKELIIKIPFGKLSFEKVIFCSAGFLVAC